jgi:hypothetical protein
MEKQCTECKEIKSLNEYSKSRNKCKDCRRKSNREYYIQIKTIEKPVVLNKMENIQEKKCDECKQIKSLNEYSKSRNKCKDCRRRLKKDYYYKTKTIEKPKIENMCCYKCNETKPINEFRKDKSRITGYTTICKECLNEYKREYKANVKQREKEKITEKLCKKCGKIKPISEYHKENVTKTGYRNKCKECYNERERDKSKKKVNTKRKCINCHVIKDKSNFDEGNIRCKECELLLYPRNETKECRSCNLVKDIGYFRKNGGFNGSYITISDECKSCTSKRRNQQIIDQLRSPLPSPLRSQNNIPPMS